MNFKIQIPQTFENLTQPIKTTIILNLIIHIQQLYRSMSAFQGLKACSLNFNTFCLSKSIQFSLSSLLIIVLTYLLCARIKRQRQVNFFVIVSLQMLLSLICNSLFCWFHQSYFLYDIQVFAFSLYFITIVYQVALRLIEKSIQIKKIYWALTHGVFLIYIIAVITTLILRLADLYQSQLCNELWILILQGLGILLSICMVFGGLKYEQMEKSKVSGFYKEEHLKNPMPSMWKWISINIFCQTLGLIESLYLQFSPEKNCTFSSNKTVQAWLNLFFDVFSYHLGLLATYWFLRKKYEEVAQRKRVQKGQFKNSVRKNSQGEDTNNIQLVTNRFSEVE